MLAGLALASIQAAGTPGCATSLPASSAGAVGASNCSGPEAASAEARAALVRDAFEIGSSIPEVPHGRDRARIQELAVQAAIELDEIAQAAQWIDGIDGWRRGAASADLALHLARAGRTGDAREHLARAEAHWDGEQAWQRQRVQAKIAAVLEAIGDATGARRHEAEVEPAERGPIEAERARLAGSAGFDARLAALDAVVGQKNFDLTRNAVGAYLEMLRANWTDAVRRGALLERIRAAMDHVPHDVRVTTRVSMAEAALAFGAREDAALFLAEADSALQAVQWYAEDRMQLRARLAVARAELGEIAEARRMLAGELEAFTAARARIVDMFRAAPLRAVAVAQARVAGFATDPQDRKVLRAESLETFRRAVEEGAINPNARPRAEDLAETKLAMARAGVAPDAALAARMLAIRAGLVAPW